MGETAAQRNDVSTARAVLDRIAGGPLRAQLVGELCRRLPGRSREEIDEAFREGYSRGLTACPWQCEKEVYGWLRSVMERLLADERRRELREPVADTCESVFERVDTSAEPLRVLARGEDRREITELHGAVARLLSERQRRVMALHAEGTERREIARRVGASEKAVKKDLAPVRRRARPCGNPLGAWLRGGRGGSAGVRSRCRRPCRSESQRGARGHHRRAACPHGR